MTDRLSAEKRSWNMSRIKGKDTAIEVAVRKYLFSKGFRYRKNDKRLPGKPDIVLPKYHTVVFVNGCFWHQHNDCKRATIPKTRTEFWSAKLRQNVENDEKKRQALMNQGWNVITLWECELEKDFSSTMTALVTELYNNL